MHLSGFTDNWWVGLAMLHTLFTREHNHICDLLAKEHPDWTDAQLYGKAKLINSALMAKIHTVEWTPAILPHPVIQIAMHANWYGLAGDELQEVFKFLNDNEILGGIVGSKHDHHTAPYSLTEEFVVGLPDASADPRRGACSARWRPMPSSKRSSCRTWPAARRPASRAASACPTCSIRSDVPTPAPSRCTTTRSTCRT